MTHHRVSPRHDRRHLHDRLPAAAILAALAVRPCARQDPLGPDPGCRSTHLQRSTGWSSDSGNRHRYRPDSFGRVRQCVLLALDLRLQIAGGRCRQVAGQLSSSRCQRPCAICPSKYALSSSRHSRSAAWSTRCLQRAMWERIPALRSSAMWSEWRGWHSSLAARSA